MKITQNPNGPNILVLFCDQLRRDALGAYGNTLIHTPNMDRLAAQGGVFERATSPTPVCIPARYCMLTGHRPKIHGYFENNAGFSLDSSIPTFPALLRNSGYTTAAIGKMHFQPIRNHHGFDRMLLMEETPRCREDDDYLLYLRKHGYGNVCHQHGVRHLLYMHPQRSLLPEQHTGSHWVADQSIEFLKENAHRRFLLWASWIAPHPPFNTIDKWADFYDAEDMPLPARSDDEDGGSWARYSHHFADVDGGSPLEQEYRIKRIKACYYAMVSLVDEQIGRVLDTLEELGLTDETLVLLTSDHGEMLGDHGMWQKSCAYQGASSIPFILRWPGRIEAGERSDAFVSLYDVLPTLLDAAEIEYTPFDSPLAGDSVLDKAAISKRETAVIELYDDERRFVCAQNKSHKLVYWYHDGRYEFYDLINDSEELHNLACGGVPLQIRENFEELYCVLYEWEKENGPHPVGGSLHHFGITELWREKRNAQLPLWPASLPPEQKKELNSLESEILQAIKKEPSVSLQHLDLTWQVEHSPAKALYQDLLKHVQLAQNRAVCHQNSVGIDSIALTGNGQ